MVVDVVELMPINNLPDAFRQGYTFAGWYIGDTKINVGSTYSFTGNQTAVAKCGIRLLILNYIDIKPQLFKSLLNLIISTKVK